jgi:hypothetical protein
LGSQKNIGDQFYEHPIIKNYGANRIFKDPSYLSAANFSTILIDVLKEDFNNKLSAIAAFKRTSGTTEEQMANQLHNGADIVKIKALFDYYAAYYVAHPDKKVFDAFHHLPRGLDKEIHCILQLHLKNSGYDFNDFVRRVEGWYNDGQDRVTGWYKRQSQFISFLIGLFIAFMFNVDTIEISSKLSKDDKARDQIVQLAIKAADSYKDDPRIRKDTGKINSMLVDTLQKKYDSSINEVKRIINDDITNANQLLAIGWGKYGRDDIGFIQKVVTKKWPAGLLFAFDPNKSDFSKVQPYVDSVMEAERIKKMYGADSLKKWGTSKKQVVSISDSTRISRTNAYYVAFYDKKMKKSSVRLRVAYIISIIGPKKLLGFLLTAFAIALGAPFWFDLLNKLVKIRAAGKKEDGPGNSTAAALPAPAAAPVTVNVNSQTPDAGEEAVG